MDTRSPPMFESARACRSSDCGPEGLGSSPTDRTIDLELEISNSQVREAPAAWKKLYEFRAIGEPKGQPRPRAFARKGLGARVYDPGTAEGWKAQVALAARPCLPSEPLAFPIWVRLQFFMPRPKSHFGTGRNAGVLKPGIGVCHLGAPDCDNLAKAVLDALTTVGFWVDDALVGDLIVSKRYGPRPGVIVTIGQRPI